jgi:glycosyltransferase involved in cell wall biosynthesis
MNSESNKPLVTVCMPLYNKVKYLRDAIESVLKQEADFDWDIIISDDHSTDGSTAIAMEYAQKYPEKIRVYVQEKNKGVGGNSIDMFRHPVSKYVTYLDSDDIYIDKKRLQKQVDFLEQHPEYGMVYGKSTLMDEVGNPLPIRRWPKYKSGNVFRDIMLFKYLPQFSSAMVRTEAVQRTLDVPDNPGTDFFFMAKIAHDNQLYYMDEFFFCYRKNQHSITVTSQDFLQSLLPAALKHFEKEHPKLIKRAFRKIKLHYATVMAEKKPSMKNFISLLKYSELTTRYFRQLGKCGLRMIKVI